MQMDRARALGITEDVRNVPERQRQILFKRGGRLPRPKMPKGKHLAFSGLIDSAVPGRTDKHPMGVKPGSYVIPSDIVSSIGEGNTAAGAKAFTEMFKTKAPQGFADGGDVEPVDIIAAGGEVVLTPEQVLEVGGGDLEAGHEILDAMVKRIREKTIRTLKALPGPVKN